jgi:hypothetical protein
VVRRRLSGLSNATRSVGVVWDEYKFCRREIESEKV